MDNLDEALADLIATLTEQDDPGLKRLLPILQAALESKTKVGFSIEDVERVAQLIRGLHGPAAVEKARLYAQQKAPSMFARAVLVELLRQESAAAQTFRHPDNLR